MHLIADRFAMDERGYTIDLATGERVHLVTSLAGGPSEQACWAERCAWFARAAHPSLAPLVDYGTVGETKRFEAWAVQSGWQGTPGAASAARARVAQFLAGCGRTVVADNALLIGSRHGRPCIVPDAGAGLPRVNGEVGVPSRDRGCLGVVREPDRHLHRVAEFFGGADAARIVALTLWMPDGEDPVCSVRELARSARLAGLVPLTTRLFDSPWRAAATGRTLVLFADEQPEAGWRCLVDASLDVAKAHVVVFLGPHTVRRAHATSPQRWSADALMASVQPDCVARAHLRALSAAARRSGGVRERFERAVFGDGFSAHRTRQTPHGRQPDVRVDSGVPTLPMCRHTRVAEQTTAYTTTSPSNTATAPSTRAGSEAPQSLPSSIRSWPAPGELMRLRRLVDVGRTLLGRGRHQPGDRALRQAMHALARRGEWVAATEAAIALARSLVDRGRLAEATDVLDGARPWSNRATDLGLLAQVAMLVAEVQIERGNLAHAECVLETALEAALSESHDIAAQMTQVLVRCLYWQGRYADAWHRLELAPEPLEASSADRVRLWTARARVAIGRRRTAEAVAFAAQARDAAIVLSDARLVGPAWYSCALAQQSAGDGVQADDAATRALVAARTAHQPLLALKARLLRAEIACRRGQRGPAGVLIKRLGAVAATLPITIRARVDVISDVLAGADAESAADRRAQMHRLPALRLFAIGSTTLRVPVPAADDIVELLQCCQSDEDAAVLTTVCARLRARLGAAAVGFFASDKDAVVCVAADGPRIEPASAARISTACSLVLPHRGGERPEAGVSVRYAGQVAGWLVAVWSPAATWHDADVALLLSTAATAAAPALVGHAARRASQRATKGSELLGVSSAIAAVRAAVEKAASAPFAVLIEGESGSGKELVARLLHKLGSRRDRPFSTLNCAALPDDLVESELFGHARGAFTGAVGERRGVFEEAHTGTLFLDEIGELSARAQAKLLRVIQEGEIRRVGENACRRVDVRLITATNRDLRAEVTAGRFRLDLLYRLDVIRVVLPALRERREDIAVLAEHFWRESAERVGSHATLSTSTIAALSRYDWPGNIRELQNVLASLAVRCPRRGAVLPSALPVHFGDQEVAGSLRLESARRTFDRAFVRAALVRAGGHRARAAEELGVSRQGLAKLMARLEIDDGQTLAARA